MRRVIQFF